MEKEKYLDEIEEIMVKQLKINDEKYQNEKKIIDLKMNSIIKGLGYGIAMLISLVLFKYLALNVDIFVNIALLNTILWAIIGSIFNGTFYSNREQINDLRKNNKHLDIEIDILELEKEKIEEEVIKMEKDVLKVEDIKKSVINENINDLRMLKYQLLNFENDKNIIEYPKDKVFVKTRG